MVRFIMRLLHDKPSKSSSIYIPIWLDLLFSNYKVKFWDFVDLHSNMVRFIIMKLMYIKTNNL